MMRQISVSHLFCLFLTTQVFAQQAVIRSQTVNMSRPIPVASAKAFTSTTASSEKNDLKKFAPADVNINIMPFFGEYEKTESQKLKDEDFLKSCDLNFATREEASQFFVTRAWEYLAEGQADTAIYRFNLAWLLNNNNVDTYWGLGVITYQKEDYQKAVGYLEHGHAIDDKNITLTVDLATVKIQCYLKDKDQRDIEEANRLLNEAAIIDPSSGNTYMKLSLAKLVEGLYDEAWAYFHKGYETDISSMDIDLLSTLLDKEDDPQGKFKK